MTIRFKSEYQKSYRVSRPSRSASPQRSVQLAGLRSDQMGMVREPGLQRRRRFCSQTCRSLLRLEDPNQTHRTRTQTGPASDTDCRGRSAQRGLPTPPAEPTPPGEPGPPADPGEPGPPADPGEPEKPHPSLPDSQSQPRSPLMLVDGQQPAANGRVLRWRAGLRSGGKRSEFSWKKPPPAASPILTAQQVLHSSSSVPPFKKHPVTMETEYRQSFLGLAHPTGPRLRKHLEHQKVPLFHTHMGNRKRREEPERKPHPRQEPPSPQKEDVRSPSTQKATPPPPQAGHRKLTEYECSFVCPLFYRIQEEGGVTDFTVPQVQQLRQQALAHRLRAWGTNFSRDHLSQLQSEHCALWEASDSTDLPSDPPMSLSPRLTYDLCSRPHGGSVEALDLASCSSHSSMRTSGHSHAHHTHSNTNAHTHAHHTHTHSGPPAERRLAWGEEDDESETDKEGRLPTPRLKLRPVQRTHHDRTTPATGGAILVGEVRRSDSLSPYIAQRIGSTVSMATGAETVDNLPLRPEGAWPESSPGHHHSPGPSPSPTSKPIRMKQNPPAPPPPHYIQGTLRHPDFQHNGDLGLRFRLQCPEGGCVCDEDDRLSVMSWRSAASCSVASTVLERAQKRRDDFWKT